LHDLIGGSATLAFVDFVVTEGHIGRDTSEVVWVRLGGDQTRNMCSMAITVIVGIGVVVKKVVSKRDQATLAEAATKSRVLVVDATINYGHSETTAEVALVAQAVDSGHDVRDVVSTGREVLATAVKMVRMATLERGLASSCDLTRREMKLANGCDGFHRCQ
jgi:hypothetical protein